MEVLHLTASQFIRPMGNGRTCPVLLGAEDDGGNRLEVVTKLRGPELDVKSQVAELVAARLAAHLGISVPQAAVVDVPEGFDVVVPEVHRTAFRGSPGRNFGSLHLGAGFTTWPADRVPAGAHREQAVAIFAFDLLVQNPDRAGKNPNLWARSSTVGVYDHELAFSGLRFPIVGGAPRPWVLKDQAAAFRFTENHVFYPWLSRTDSVGSVVLARSASATPSLFARYGPRIGPRLAHFSACRSICFAITSLPIESARLRGSQVDLGPFGERLQGLSDDVIHGLLAGVPEEWRDGHDLCEVMGGYLREAREESAAFLDYVKHLLG